MGHGPSNTGGVSRPKKSPTPSPKLSERGKERFGDAKDRLRELGYDVRVKDITDAEAAYLDRATHIARTALRNLGVGPEAFADIPNKHFIIERDPYFLRDYGYSTSDGFFAITPSAVRDNRVTTIAHELTHQLILNAIHREINSQSFSASLDPDERRALVNSTSRDATIERTISTNAFDAWKSWKIERITTKLASVKDGTPQSEALKGELFKIKDMTHPYEAVDYTGMGSYAKRDYDYAPKGSGMEIPTVAMEEFVRYGTDPRTLLQNSSYAFFVLKELKKIVKKK